MKRFASRLAVIAVVSGGSLAFGAFTGVAHATTPGTSATCVPTILGVACEEQGYWQAYDGTTTYFEGVDVYGVPAPLFDAEAYVTCVPDASTSTYGVSTNVPALNSPLATVPVANCPVLGP